MRTQGATARQNGRATTRALLSMARREALAGPPLRRSSAPDGVLLRCMIGSGIGHVVVLLIMFLLADIHFEAGGGGGGGPIVVSLVSLAGPARNLHPAPVQLAVEQPKPPAPAPKKPPVENAVPVPVPDRPKATAPKPDERKPDPPKVESRSTREDESTNASSGGGQPAGDTGQGGGSPGFGGGTGFGTGSGSGLGRLFARVDEGFAYDYYLQVVAAKISAVWMPPVTGAGNDSSTAAIVRFRIMREGRVQLAEIEESSALPVFDASARDAILSAQPYPPFPPEYGGQWLTVHLRFTVAN